LVALYIFKAMANYKKIIPHILHWEGGWVNDVDDPGGATMKGITFLTFKAYRKAIKGKAPTITDLKNISDIEWEAVFKKFFWDRCKGDQIQNQNIANMIVDWTWSSGKWGIVIPQRILGVTADGLIGPATIQAINNYPNQKELFNKLVAARKKYYEDIVKNRPTSKKYLKGWLNRLNALKWEE
jgi:lysozyme family protein